MSADRVRPKSEAELCDRFAALARDDGWTVYPETSGWDLLLVASKDQKAYSNDDHAWTFGEQGTQIGVEAKLRSNFLVLSQALKYRNWTETQEGPDFRAVLVPGSINGFDDVAQACGIGVFDLGSFEKKDYHGRRQSTVSIGGLRPWPYLTRCWLPDSVPDLPAGVPSPRQMTRWKQAAMKVCAVLRERGYVTSVDFRQNGISTSTWVDRWIIWSGERIDVNGTKLHKYVVKPDAVLPDGRAATEGVRT